MSKHGAEGIAKENRNMLNCWFILGWVRLCWIKFVRLIWDKLAYKYREKGIGKESRNMLNGFT